MQATRIILLCVAAAVLYGIAHDNITARLCLEYFTVGHRRAFASDSPTLHAFYWGVVATWWVGLPLGVVVACGARLGSRPPVDARAIVRPLGTTLVAIALVALLAGVASYVFTGRGPQPFRLPGPLFEQVAITKHRAFATCWATHVASYYAGALFGLVLAIRVFRMRARSSS